MKNLTQNEVRAECHEIMKEALGRVLGLMEHNKVANSQEITLDVLTRPAIMVAQFEAHNKDVAVGGELFNVHLGGVTLTATTYLDEELYPDFFDD